MYFVYSMIHIYEGIQTKNSLMSFQLNHYHLIKNMYVLVKNYKYQQPVCLHLNWCLVRQEVDIYI